MGKITCVKRLDGGLSGRLGIAISLFLCIAHAGLWAEPSSVPARVGNASCLRTLEKRLAQLKTPKEVFDELAGGQGIESLSPSTYVQMRGHPVIQDRINMLRAKEEAYTEGRRVEVSRIQRQFASLPPPLKKRVKKQMEEIFASTMAIRTNGYRSLSYDDFINWVRYALLSPEQVNQAAAQHRIEALDFKLSELQSALMELAMLKTGVLNGATFGAEVDLKHKIEGWVNELETILVLSKVSRVVDIEAPLWVVGSDGWIVNGQWDFVVETAKGQTVYVEVKQNPRYHEKQMQTGSLATKGPGVLSIYGQRFLSGAIATFTEYSNDVVWAYKNARSGFERRELHLEMQILKYALFMKYEAKPGSIGVFIFSKPADPGVVRLLEKLELGYIVKGSGPPTLVRK